MSGRHAPSRLQRAVGVALAVLILVCLVAVLVAVTIATVRGVL